ncbi:hypothetical protein GCM10009771_15340 [Nesterenkonia flava]
MSVDACGCASPREDTASAETTKEPRWWGDRRVLIPLGSGLLLGTGWVLEWSGLADQAPLSTVTLAVFWVSLLFGASQFVPGALRVARQT